MKDKILKASVGRTSWSATQEQRNTWEYMKLYKESEQ